MFFWGERGIHFFIGNDPFGRRKFCHLTPFEEQHIRSLRPPQEFDPPKYKSPQGSIPWGALYLGVCKSMVQMEDPPPPPMEGASQVITPNFKTPNKTPNSRTPLTPRSDGDDEKFSKILRKPLILVRKTTKTVTLTLLKHKKLYMGYGIGNFNLYQLAHGTEGIILVFLETRKMTIS